MAAQAASETTKKAAEQARTAAGELADELALLKMQVEELTAELAGHGKQKAEAAARQMAATAREGYEKAAEGASAAYDETERLVTKRPATTLALAAGLGVLIGMALSRR